MTKKKFVIHFFLKTSFASFLLLANLTLQKKKRLYKK